MNLPIVLLVLIAAGAAGWWFFLRKPSGPAQVPVTSNPMDAVNWTIGPIIDGKSLSPGMPLHPVPHPSGWCFDFPSADGVHYLTRPPMEAGRGSLRLKFAIEGDGQIVSVQGGALAKVTLYIQRKGDNYAADHPSYRFFAGGDAFTLNDFARDSGDGLIEVLLTADMWTNVFGHSDAAGLQALLSDMECLGFCFGDPAAGATGHGARVIGNARFICKEFGMFQ